MASRGRVRARAVGGDGGVVDGEGAAKKKKTSH